MKSIAYLFLVALSTSCTSLPGRLNYANPEAAGYAPAARGVRSLDASVFSGDTSVVSDEEIARALDYEYDPSQIRSIALVPCGGVSPELIGSQAEIFAQISAVNPQLELVRIPRSLMPRELTAAHLRSLAARLQADTVILYEIQKNYTYNEKLFRSDTAKFWVTLEFYLFDTRSGLIPHSNAFDRVVETKKTEGSKPWDYIEENFRTISAELLKEMATDLRSLTTGG